LTDPATHAPRDGWCLADTRLPFSEDSFPVGLQGTGRLVTVTVVGRSRARFAERHNLIGANLGLLSHTRLSGEVRLEAGFVRVTVYASAPSILLVGGIAGVFILGGLHLFLSSPSLGTALAGAACVGAGSWLALQISRAGHEVAADAAHILGLMARGEGTSVFTA
jgi:hypothetical protein